MFELIIGIIGIIVILAFVHKVIKLWTIRRINIHAQKMIYNWDINWLKHNKK